jgi:hypothetical protein
MNAPRRGWALLCFAFGCTHARPPQAPRAHAAPVLAPAPPLNPRLELPALGLEVRPPAPMELFENDAPLPDGMMHTQGVACSVGTQDYFVARYFRGARDRAKDEIMLENAKHALAVVSRATPIKMGEWSGIELEGKTKNQHDAWLRFYVVGDGFWIAQVERSDGALDRVAARAFFDSIVLRQPWSVHAFPEAHFSALMPDGGVRLGKKELNGGDFTVAEASWLGGSETRAYFVWAIPLGEGSLTPDERMDRGLEALGRDGNRVVWQAPLSFDDARGRDILLQNKTSWARVRFLVTASNLYMLQAAARTKDDLLDESVLRFLTSIRWY